MRSLLAVVLLSGCSVLQDARNEFYKDVSGLKSEITRLYFKENPQ